MQNNELLCSSIKLFLLYGKVQFYGPCANDSKPSQLSDFGPIALTLLVMKYFERLVKKHIIPKTQHLLDRLQFAVQESRGVEDAIATSSPQSP